MDLREHTGKFLSDLAKIVFGSVIITQLMSGTINLLALFYGLAGVLGLFITSLFILRKGDNKNE